jgi:hypothetical protein
MLDLGHRLVLRSVAAGKPPRESPALDNLVATGLVTEDDGRHELTAAGRIALDAGRTTKLERFGWPIVVVCLVIVAVVSVIELFL